ncbi:MAG: ABC transporter substrate-binding protein [Candidatus Thermoplasmatota archaeon]|nr:ABC transporter substrate-binding protein [Candidatus Thermoplasmatota archaeon]
MQGSSDSGGAGNTTPPEKVVSDTLTKEQKGSKMKIIIPIVVVIILVVGGIAAYMVLVKPSAKTSTAPGVSLAVSSTVAAGQSLSFKAITTGTVSNVTIYFGDGTSSTGTPTSGSYIANHTYNNVGNYLVEAVAKGSAGSASNLASLSTITVTPGTVNASVAAQSSEPLLITKGGISGQIFNVSQSISFELASNTLSGQLTAPNWTVGYYIINYGNGHSEALSAYFNTTSGAFDKNVTTYTYNAEGMYPVSLSVVTYNNTAYTGDIVNVKNSTGAVLYQYLPLSYMSKILSTPGEYQNLTAMKTLYIKTSNETVGILSPGKVINPGVINSAEVVPGGPYSFDPAIDYETVGMEVLANTYETLIAYNGSNAGQFVPTVATEVPTVANGGISSNYLNYTFTIRSGLKFSNGDPLTAFDVYVSMVRTLLFIGGSPGTAGWILAQDLLPYGGFGPNGLTNSYANITRAITYDNSTNTVTFHLLKVDPAFLDYLADPEGGSIMDYNWLAAHGANITFTPAGFQYYTTFANEVSYNTYVQTHIMGSGPYMVSTYITGESIVLVPNPYYTPIPGYPGYNKTPTEKVYIQWIKDPSVGLLMLESGQADIVTGLPPSDYPTVQKYEAAGKVTITQFPTLSVFFNYFNWNISQSIMKKLGSSYSVPQYYFANQYVRRAFADAYNYSEFVNYIVGNKVFGATFGFSYVGIIPKGMPGYVPPSQIQNAPSYNLAEATAMMYKSGQYNTTVNIPYIVPSGDTLDYAMGPVWATALAKVDPHITLSTIYLPFSEIIGYSVAGSNGLPLVSLGWAPDFPYPTDYVNAMYLQGGTYPAENGWSNTTLITAGHPSQAAEWTNMTNLILKGDNTGNATLAISYFDQAQQIAVNLTLYVYTQQENGFWFYSSYLHGAQYEQNPMLGGGGDTLYFYLTK